MVYFDLDTDYETYMNAANPRDKYLGAAIKAGDGIRILRQDLWEMIVTFLISQQNNIKRRQETDPQMYRNYLSEIWRAKSFINRCGILCVSNCGGAESGNGRELKRLRPWISGKIYRSDSQDYRIRRNLPGKNL